MQNSVIKIGIIGPRSYSLGGHDRDNDIRVSLRAQFEEILQDTMRHDITILGVTGLSSGVEQDFAQVCINNNTDYICYIPYLKYEENWNKIESVKKYYEYLLDKSLSSSVISLSESYAPKKIFNKNKFIISDSDIIIYVPNPLRRHECPYLKLCIEMEKDVIQINNV